jgi:site-specific recombinase XerD
VVVPEPSFDWYRPNEVRRLLSGARDHWARTVLLFAVHTRVVFCRVDGKPFTLWQLHERLWSACRRAGLREIRWHDLRHSFACQLVSAGVPLRQVQDWLGHSTMTMTMRYSHLAPGHGADLIRALENPSAVANTWQSR